MVNARLPQKWQEFAQQVRSEGCQLLSSLDKYTNPILVTGCQRSGTTILARILKGVDGIESPQYCRDDELSDALLLSGRISPPTPGRYCFQTTFVNECVHEYFESGDDYKIIWVVRNPYSVVYSMVNNWGKFAFNELFRCVGSSEMTWSEKIIYDRVGRWGVSRIDKACMSYIAKSKQLFALCEKFDDDKLYVIDYDELVTDKEVQLKNIFDFLELEYQVRYGEMMHSSSTGKQQGFREKERKIIEDRCLEVYENSRRLVRKVG